MTKILKFLFILLMPLALVACGNHDKDELETGLLGKWEVTGSIDLDYWEKPCIFNFRENEMLTITFAQGRKNEEAFPCRYFVNGSKIKIDFGYGDEVFEGTYKIKGKTLTLDIITYDPEDPQYIYKEHLELRRI